MSYFQLNNLQKCVWWYDIFIPFIHCYILNIQPSNYIMNITKNESCKIVEKTMTVEKYIKKNNMKKLKEFMKKF